MGKEPCGRVEGLKDQRRDVSGKFWDRKGSIPVYPSS